MRERRSSSDCSSFWNCGASWRARRAVELAAMSHASWICLLSGYMSGASRALGSTSASSFRALACWAPFSRIAESARNMGAKVSLAMVWIEISTVTSSGW
jgi:hypothetical protein